MGEMAVSAERFMSLKPGSVLERREIIQQGGCNARMPRTLAAVWSGGVFSCLHALMSDDSTNSKVRLDKWLWAARFFKTRSLASTAVNGGKVHVNDQRVKPSRTVSVGDAITVQRGFDRLDIVVEGLSDKRGPAKVAQTLYRETGESLRRREEAAAMRKAANQGMRPSEHRPSGRDRRLIRSFTGKDMGKH